MAEELKQLAESGLNRVLIISSVLNYRRSLAMALLKLLPEPIFTALDPAEQGLPDENYEWSSADILLVDLSEYKPEIRAWFFEISSSTSVPPVIFLDNRATVDDAGDMVRAGAADYIDVTHLNTRRLARALLFAASSRKNKVQQMDEGQPVENLEATQLLSVIKDELPTVTDTFPNIRPMTDEPTEVLPALTPAMLEAMQDGKESVEEEASFLTTGLMDILDRQQLEKAAMDEPETISGSTFLTSGLMSILERDQVVENELPKAVVEQATSLTMGKRWPFTQQQLDQGEANIGEYQVLEFIAVGGTASVFKARHHQGGDIVALKLFDNDAGDDNGQERFLRGYQLIEQIKHPNIVSIKERLTCDGYVFVVMEYFSGGDLKTQIERGLSREDAVRHTAEVAAALDAAHQQKILHRDLKPSNVMLRQDGSLALLDFGIATLMAEGASHLTQVGHIVGTSHYVSPEQAVGGELDARSDLYALGVMLYEMLEAKRPYTGSSPIEIMQQHVQAPVPMLSSTSDPLNPVVRCLMAKDPGDRYASGAEVINALAQAIPALVGDDLLQKLN
jgi:hypothetical protein